LTFSSPNKLTYTLSSKASFGAIDKKNEKRERERERRDPPARAFLFLSKKKKKTQKRERLGEIGIQSK